MSAKIKVPIALQLWSLKELQERDFAHTVAEVARMGYDGVELAGYGNLDATGAQKAIADSGLKVAGMHVGIDRLRSNLGQVVTEALAFNTSRIICPWWNSAHFRSVAAVQDIGGELAGIGRRLRAYGMQLSFHNHAAEMRLLEQRTVLEWMMSAAAPCDLTCELDVYWAETGGQSAVNLLRRLGSRCTLVHLKDHMDIGQGPVDFPAVIKTVNDIGSAEWFVIEQERYTNPPLESVSRNLAQVRNWLSQ